MRTEILIAMCGGLMLIMGGLFSDTVYASPQVSGYDSIYIGSWYYAALYNITPQNETLDCSISIWDNGTSPETLVYVQTQLNYEFVEVDTMCSLMVNSTIAKCWVYIDPSYIVYYEPDPVDYSIMIQCENGILGKKHVVSENRKPVGDWLVREILWIQENMGDIITLLIIIVSGIGAFLLIRYAFF